MATKKTLKKTSGIYLLGEGLLEVGSGSLNCAALGDRLDREVELGDHHLMDLRIQKATARIPSAGSPSGVSGTRTRTDVVMLRFEEVLPYVAELAALQNAVVKLAH